MRKLRTVALFAVATCLGSAPAAPAQEAKHDALLGDWDIVWMVYKGKVQHFGVKPNGGQVTIADGRLWFDGRVGPGYRITGRPSASPPEIDVDFGGAVSRGIYEVRDGSVVLVLPRFGDDRPKTFDALGNPRLTLYTLRKPKK